jgi:hypothetical protein
MILFDKNRHFLLFLPNIYFETDLLFMGEGDWKILSAAWLQKHLFLGKLMLEEDKKRQ